MEETTENTTTALTELCTAPNCSCTEACEPEPQNKKNKKPSKPKLADEYLELLACAKDIMAHYESRHSTISNPRMQRLHDILTQINQANS